MAHIPSDNEGYYIPHHAVIKKYSTPSKIRVQKKDRLGDH